ncbi:transporter substrate-binding domain-containing protein [Chitinivibrio alkaliphilus]|uniref:Multi-sensor hybrid histidine kinase n=1 Tax=Chitinivibrio alkaliphilus ACht1 TaxID=1313304 RepID=U7D7R7_9BACT|nr:transporter substrate-binding domain-containing protein [Chitinivibrio alkaliphilus]ERP31137.1 multi-sensor hybrid histidine kinase [Chitinivibrio alkaliphilus ACht1]
MSLQSIFSAVILMVHVFTVHAWGVSYTREESRFIDTVGTVYLCVDPYWEPYELLHEDGSFTGIAADLIDRISQRTGIEFEIVPTENWSESLEYMRNGKCDVLAFLNYTEERAQWMNFTESYYTTQNVFVTRSEHPDIHDLNDFTSIRAVLPEGTSIEERFRREYPHVEIILVETEVETFEAVHAGKADFTFRSLPVAAFLIRNEGWFSLKVAGTLEGYDNNFRMGCAPDLPLLPMILNKGIV